MTYKGLKNILGQFRDLLVPAGTVTLFAGTTIPTRYLLCNGLRVKQMDYPKLFAAIGHTWALSTDTDAMKAEYFRLPDMRECVAVGAGTSSNWRTETTPSTAYYRNQTRVFDTSELKPATGTSGNQNHDAYLLGTFKDDQFQEHYHNGSAWAATSGSGSDLAMNRGGGQWIDGYARATEPTDASPTNQKRTGTTTHGKQVGLYYIIKY